ncbi:glutamate--tRNA ligase [Candidatus Falkowbacteria bacterium]|nr:glutamate--tRNA ligase [Candidatus Falkowbacteria bacterium]
MDKLNLANVRVRIAPSPTGFVHVGNLRTILYNYLFAKHYNGKFIIRIEDTDQSRLVPGAIDDLLKVLKWAGIESDEGPYLTVDNKIKERGEFSPYTQSKRSAIYNEQMRHLIDKGKAYYCFCSKERLEKLREAQTKNKLPPKYDTFCRNLTKDEVQAMLNNGAPYVIRFKMPENKRVVFNDLIRGEISVNTKNLDDYVLIKSDGFPTYHFANIIDDHLMKITHVMRGDEWIASTPKHILLYEAFGWQAPAFAHLPILLNKQKKKLSKRDGDTAVRDFIEKGYLSEAFINFIALLGWNAGTEQEVYTLNELIKQFSVDNIHKASAVFDLDKLDWINGLYIRKLSLNDFYSNCLPFLESNGLLNAKGEAVVIVETNEKVKPAYVKNILKLEQTRISKFSDIAEAIKYFFTEKIEYSADKLLWKKTSRQSTLASMKALELTLKKIKTIDFTKEKLRASIMELIEKNNLETGGALWPMRFALSGREKSPDPFEIAEALGKKKTLDRINKAILKLL